MMNTTINVAQTPTPNCEPSMTHVVLRNKEILADIIDQSTKLAYTLTGNCPDYPEAAGEGTQSIFHELSMQNNRLGKVVSTLGYILDLVGE